MPTILQYLTLQELGINRSRKFLESKKAVLEILEYEAAKPVLNQACHFSGESRATFLVDFSPNMRRAASTHGDHTVRVTDIQKGKCTHILTGHPRTPWCVAFNPTSSDILASGCLGGEVRIWDLLGGGSEVLQNPIFGAVITSLAFHPSGQVLVFATTNCVYFWDWTQPTPFAVTKTSHEYERIRWLRFDPFGQYLFTGIANNSSVRGESARNTTTHSTRRDNGPGDSSRSLYDSLRGRYNRLQQRYHQAVTMRQWSNPSSDYPEHVNPRSPVHEENLNLARQYAGHVTQAQAAAVRTGQRLHFLLSNREGETQRDADTADGVRSDAHSAAHPVDHPDSGLRLGGAMAPGGASSTATLVSEMDRNSRRRWGRYQPSFFTPSDNNNNDRLGFDDNNNDYNQHNPNLASSSSSHASTNRLLDQRSSSSALWNVTSSSSSAFSPFVAAESNSSASGGQQALESNEFEILPVDQEEGAGVSTAASVSSSASVLNSERISSSENQQQELQSLLRRYRTTLSVLSSSATSTTTTPSLSLRSSSSSSSSHSSFSGHHSAAVASATNPTSSNLSVNRLVLSRISTSGRSATSTDFTSSTPSVTIIRNPAFAHERMAASSGRSSRTATLGINSSSLDLTSTSESSIATRRQQPLLTVLISRSSPAPQNPSSSSSWRPYTMYTSTVQPMATVTADRTSQTHGAMNVPERLDQSTDIQGLEEVQGESSCMANNEFSAPSNNNSSMDNFASRVSNDFNAASGPGSNVIDNSRDHTHAPIGEDNRGISLTSTSQGLNASSAVPVNSRLLPNAEEESDSCLLTTSDPATIISGGAGTNLVQSSLNVTSQISISNAGGVLQPSCSKADSQVSSHSDTQNNNALSSSGLTSATSNVLNIPRGQLLRTKLSEVTVAAASSASSSSSSSTLQNYRLASSSSVVIHPAPSMTSISSYSLGRSVAETTTTATSSILDPIPSSSSFRGNLSNLERRPLGEMRSRFETSDTSTGGSADPVVEVQERLQQAVQQLREVQSRVQELTSASLAHAASVTDYLYFEQRVSDLDRRISDLEHRVESSGYLLSNNPLYRSRLGPHRLTGSRSRSARGLGRENPPSSNLESGHLGRPLAHQRRRNQLLMSYLVNMGSSRAPQSHRNLSFNPSSSSSSSSSTSSQLSSSSLLPSSSSSSSSSLSSQAPYTGAAASASVPLSITIHPSDAERDVDGDDMSLLGGGHDLGGGGGGGAFRRRGGIGAALDSSSSSDWRTLQHIHLHPDYSSSILDETINRPNEAVQQIMNRTIAGAFLSRDEQAVASNIAPQTHRIQRWDISRCVVPDISEANENIVVEHCKLHNDATCDISRNGSALATFVPSHRGFPDDNILGVFSLEKESFGQCIYTKSFGPNAISVSISPLNHYVMVGLAAKRFFFATPSHLVGQVFKLVKRKGGEKSMAHVTDLYHQCSRGQQGHISVNSGRWLPGIGEGIVYGTNRGDLQFCRPGPRKVPDMEASESRGIHRPNLTGAGWRRSAVRSNMATQTTTGSIRRSSSTQTPDGDSDA